MTFDEGFAALEEDTWLRWRWHIPLLRARGELALAEGQYDEAWTYAAQSLELAPQTIEAIAANLQIPRLRCSFLGAAPVLEVYGALGHRPPPATP